MCLCRFEATDNGHIREILYQSRPILGLPSTIPVGTYVRMIFQLQEHCSSELLMAQAKLNGVKKKAELLGSQLDKIGTELKMLRAKLNGVIKKVKSILGSKRDKVETELEMLPAELNEGVNDEETLVHRAQLPFDEMLKPEIVFTVGERNRFFTIVLYETILGKIALDNFGHFGQFVYMLLNNFQVGSAAVSGARLPSKNEAIVRPTQVNYVGRATNFFKISYNFKDTGCIISKRLNDPWLRTCVRILVLVALITWCRH